MTRAQLAEELEIYGSIVARCFRIFTVRTVVACIDALLLVVRFLLYFVNDGRPMPRPAPRDR